METSRQWLGSNSLTMFPLAIPLTRTVDPEGPLASLLGAHRLAVPQSGVEHAAGRDEPAIGWERPHINPPWIPDEPQLAVVQVEEVLYKVGLGLNSKLQPQRIPARLRQSLHPARVSGVWVRFRADQATPFTPTTLAHW